MSSRRWFVMKQLKVCLWMVLGFLVLGGDLQGEPENWKDHTLYDVLSQKSDATPEEIQASFQPFRERQELRIAGGKKTLGGLSVDEQIEVFEKILLDPRARRLYDIYSNWMRTRDAARRKSDDLHLFYEFLKSYSESKSKWDELLEFRIGLSPMRAFDVAYHAVFGAGWQKQIGQGAREFLETLGSFYEKSYTGARIRRKKPMHSLFPTDRGSVGYRLRHGAVYCVFALAGAGTALGAQSYFYPLDRNIEHNTENQIAETERPGDHLRDHFDAQKIEDEALEQKAIEEHQTEVLDIFRGSK